MSIHIARFLNDVYDYTLPIFENENGETFTLDERTFLYYNKEKRTYFVNNDFKYFFKLIRENPYYSTYGITLNSQNKIINIMEMPLLPQYLNKFYKEHTESDNFALSVQKYGRYVKDKLVYMNFEQTGLFHPYVHDAVLINHIQNKLRKQIEVFNTNHKVSELNLTQHWRFVMGMGNASAYDNGFTFHPVYGIPYIPAQNIKGILRFHIITTHFENSEEKAEKDPVFCHYLGCSEKSYDGKARKGQLQFLDAFPVNKFEIEPDIMNPHYGDYYTKDNVAPHDALDPKPIIFLSLKEATFNFVFYLHKDKDINPSEFEFQIMEEQILTKYLYENYSHKNAFFNNNNQTISSLLYETLIESLEIRGIGAKTRVGYGRFIKTKQNS